MRVLIAGCGRVGTVLGLDLARKGWHVWGGRRSEEPLPQPIQSLRLDLNAPETLASLPPELDFVVCSASSDAPEDEAYRRAYVEGPAHLLRALQAQGQKPRRVFFASSTSVYAQQDGSWVDESSPTEPRHFTGRRILEGERLILGGPFPATVIRFAGIYGPDRLRLLQAVREGRATCPKGGPFYSNRIHRDDAVRVLVHLMELESPLDCYLAADCEPAERCQLLRWLARRLGAPPPRVEALASNARSLRTSKRCRNARLRSSGFVFRFPTYREGYHQILQEVDL